MYFKRLLETPIGISFISIILGLGLATLFRKVCTDKNCIVFNGPVISDVQDKIYKYNDKCYKYTIEPNTCDEKKKIIDIKSSIEKDNFQTFSAPLSSQAFSVSDSYETPALFQSSIFPYSSLEYNKPYTL